MELLFVLNAPNSLRKWETNNKWPRKSPMGVALRWRGTGQWGTVETWYKTASLSFTVYFPLMIFRLMPLLFSICLTNAECPKGMAYNKGANSSTLPNPLVFPLPSRSPRLTPCVTGTQTHQLREIICKSQVWLLVFVSEMERGWLYQLFYFLNRKLYLARPDIT